MVSSHEVSPRALDRTAEAIVFTWEGAAGEGAGSPGRRLPVPPLRRRVESLCSAGVDVAVISRADVADVAARLRARPRGPGHVLLSDGRGPVVELGPGDHRRVHRRPAARAAGPATRYGTSSPSSPSWPPGGSGQAWCWS